MASALVAGRTIHYRAAGPPAGGGGRRLLYVHGTGCNAEVWGPHMATMADRHAAVAIDLPGHGRSPGPGFRGVADYAHVVVELARVLGWERFVVVGHSMGGAVALITALYHADVLDGLVLVDTGARLRVHPALLRGAREAAAAGRPATTDRSWAYAADTPPALVDALHALVADTDPWVTYGDWIADDTFDVLGRLKDIRVPTLAVCGAEDRLTPVRYHEFLAAHIVGCRLQVIPGAGHWVFWERPEAFTRTLRAFVDGLPGASGPGSGAG
jgi:pimeloyl-ACP methyl ester carboxylesterase